MFLPSHAITFSIPIPSSRLFDFHLTLSPLRIPFHALTPPKPCLSTLCLCGWVGSGCCFLGLLNSLGGLSLELWLVLHQAKKVAQKDHDGDLANGRHVNRGLLLDLGGEVL